MQEALGAIKGGHVAPPSIMPSFQDIKDTLAFDRYYKEDKKYQVVEKKYKVVRYDAHFSYSVYNEHYVNMQFPNHLLPLVGQVKDATTLEPQIDSNIS